MSTITVTPTVDLASNPPRVRLDVSDANLPGYFAADVVRINPDGTIVPVRTPQGGPVTLATSGANRVGVVYDYEASYGAPVSYSTLQSPSVISAPVTVDESRVWLTHPGVPELSVPLELRAGSLAEEVEPVAQGVFYPMGRRTPVVFTDGARRAPSSSVSVETATLDELRRLRTLLADASILLLNVPATLGWGIEANYISVGEVSTGRPSDIGADQLRAVSFGFTVVDRPAGGTQAERTLLDLSTYASLGAIAAAYPSLAAAAAGP